MTVARRTIAVALHDIEPATFERCALIRDWLDDHGVDRVTLLVIPARDLHPLAERSPDIVNWLIERERGGDAIAQHGFQHLRSQPARGRYQPLGSLRAYDEAEFLGLDAHETRRAVSAGRRVLKLAGIEPRGFVAPAYAYTPALRSTLGEHFHWWAALLGVHRAYPAHARIAAGEKRAGQSERAGQSQSSERNRDRLGPPLSLMSSGRLRRALSPALLRAGALMSGSTLRLDLHPADLDHPGHMLALEWVLKRSGSSREAVTYDELAFARKSGDIRHSACLPVTIADTRYPPESNPALKGFTSERPA
jgi:predicted deacetylase